MYTSVTEDRTFKQRYSDTMSPPDLFQEIVDSLWRILTTRYYARHYNHHFFIIGDRQSHGPTSALLWLCGGMQRIAPAMFSGPGDATAVIHHRQS